MSLYMFWAETNKINQKKMSRSLYGRKKSKFLFLKGFKSMYYALIHPFSYYFTNVRMMLRILKNYDDKYNALKTKIYA